MTLTIPLSSQAESALLRRAEILGKDPAVVAAEMLTAELGRAEPLSIDNLLTISGDTFEAYKASGQSEEALADELDRIKHIGRSLITKNN